MILETSPSILNSKFGEIENTTAFFLPKPGANWTSFVCNNLFGLKDSITKNITLFPKYFFIDTFSNNLALFNPDSCGDNCRYGFINKIGDIAVEPKFSDAFSFSGIVAPVAVTSNKNNETKWGFINRFGEWMISPIFEFALQFKNGLSLVQSSEKKFGFVNSSGVLQIPAQYSDAHSFSDSLAAIKLDSVKWGFINLKNEIIIAPRFKDVSDFHEQLCAAQDTSLLWGFIDRTGNWKIKPQYLKAENFDSGKAQVMLKPKNKTDLPKLKFIDKDGKFVK